MRGRGSWVGQDRAGNRVRKLAPGLAAALLLTLTACDHEPEVVPPHLATPRDVARLIPARLSRAERADWANDLTGVFDDHKVTRTLTNLCTAIAIIDQESNFSVDPAVPGLGAKAERELTERFHEHLGDVGAARLRDMLATQPTPEDSFLSRLRMVKTEQQLDHLYREIFEHFRDQWHLGVVVGVADLFSQHGLAERLDPVKTLGSMQVRVDFALADLGLTENPWDARDKLFTRRGGLDAGVRRLMDYPAAYPIPLYRFADYNSGVYASRNAAFQQIINRLRAPGTKPIALDGDLLAWDGPGDSSSDVTDSETAIRGVLASHGVTTISDGALRRDLETEKSPSFEQTETWTRLRALWQAENHTRRLPPYAVMPQVVISGPKLRRDYDTAWYANGVQRHFNACEARGRGLNLKR